MGRTCHKPLLCGGLCVGQPGQCVGRLLTFMIAFCRGVWSSSTDSTVLSSA